MKTCICHECAFDSSEIEIIGHAVKEHWFCAYSRPEYGHAMEFSQCEYFENADDEEAAE